MKFILTCRITLPAYAVVEAGSEAAALEIANNVSLGFQLDDNGRFKPVDTWILEETDGFPNDITSSGECPPERAKHYR